MSKNLNYKLKKTTIILTGTCNIALKSIKSHERKVEDIDKYFKVIKCEQQGSEDIIERDIIEIIEPLRWIWKGYISKMKNKWYYETINRIMPNK